MAERQGALFPHPDGEQLPLSETDPTPHPLDVPQEFAPASSHQVRDELEALVRRDLLGPWDGEHEVFAPAAMGPRERYLVGMLGPKQGSTSRSGQPDEVPDLATAVQGDTTEPDLPEVLTPQTLGKMWASSMGLSFAVPQDLDVLLVTAAWGRYAKQETEDEQGGKRGPWAREPVSYTKQVRLDGPPSYKLPLTAATADEPGVLLAVDVRPRDGRRVVQLALVNAQAEPRSNKDTAWLFQCGLAVSALDGDAAVFLPIDDPADDLEGVSDDREETHLRLLYRGHRRYAAGRNVAVHPHVREGERRAVKLETV